MVRQGAGNPFHPTFGAAPYVLVGRDEPLDDFEDAFEVPDPSHPGLTVLITGARGMGKTVLLSEFRDAARRQGWIGIQETARPGLMERLGATHLPRLLAEHHPTGPDKLKQLGFTVMGNGLNATWESRYPVQETVRTQIESLCDALAAHGTGLVITVDEVTAGDQSDLQALGEIAQFARTDGRLLAFGASGLTTYLDEFLDLRGTTFLRRAERYDIGNVKDLRQVADALRVTIHDAGGSITEGAAVLAAKETHGYPFLIQRIGFDLWRQAGTARTVTEELVREVTPHARRRLGRSVHAPALVGLSNVDKSYLLAMSLDDGPSRTAAVAERMGVSPQYANTYRVRLIEDGLIEEAGYGAVRYSIPYLGDYLRESGEHEALRTLADGGAQF